MTSETTITYAGVGPNYKGGFSYSWDDRTESGTTFQFRNDNAQTVGKAEWRMRNQKLMCLSSWNDTTVEDSGERRWIPLNWTLGNVKNTVTDAPYFTCNTDYRTTIQGPTWVSQQTKMAYRGFAELAGVGLDVRQERNKTLKDTLDVRDGYAKAWICGKGADPVAASWVREYLMQ